MQFPLADHPYVLAVSRWLKHHPGLSLLIFLLVWFLRDVVQFISSAWSLHSSTPLLSVVSEKVQQTQMPTFNAHSIATVISWVFMLGFIYLLLIERRGGKGAAVLTVEEAMNPLPVRKGAEVVAPNSPETPNAAMVLDYVAQIKTLATDRDQQKNAAIRYQNEVVELRKTIEKHGCSEGWLHDMANAQAIDIRDSIEVLGVRVWTFELHDTPATIKCGILFKNRSLYPISVNQEPTGDLYFNRVRLAERKFLRVVTSNLAQGGEGEIIFDQRLSRPEVEAILGAPQGRFNFTDLAFPITSSNTAVQPQTLRVSESFRPRLDEEITRAVLDVLSSDSHKDAIMSIPHGQLVISKAEYGTGSVWIDVADVLRSRIYQNGSRLRLSDAYNDTFGDPVRGAPKYLKIIYLHNGERFSVELPENTRVTLPVPYSKLNGH